MKTIFTLLVLIAKLYLGFKILSWVFMEMYSPELHNISEIEGYLVFVIFDIWLSHSVSSINSTKEND